MTYVSERKSSKNSKISEENLMILKLLGVNHFLKQKELVQRNTELLSMTRPSAQGNSKNSTPKSQNRVLQPGKFTPPCGESFYEDDAMMISSTLVNFKERNRTSYQPDELEVKRENCPGKFKFKSTSTPSNNISLVHKEETDNFNFDWSFFRR